MTPPQLGETGPVTLGGPERPRRTRDEVWTETRGAGVETPPQLGGLGLGPQGRETGPSTHRVGVWIAMGRVGIPDPKLGRQVQGTQGGPKGPRRQGGDWRRQRRQRRRAEVPCQKLRRISMVDHPSPPGGGQDFVKHCGASAREADRF